MFVSNTDGVASFNIKTISKSYTNNYNELVMQVMQQQQCERERDRQANNEVTIEFSRNR